MPNNIITGQLVNIAQLNVERIFPPDLAHHVLISQTLLRLSVKNLALYPSFDSHLSADEILDRSTVQEKKSIPRHVKVTRCIFGIHEETNS